MDETTLRMFSDETVLHMIQDAALAGAMPFAQRLVRELIRRNGRESALTLLSNRFWDIPAAVWEAETERNAENA